MVMGIKRYRVVAVSADTPDILSKITNQLSLHNYEIESISSLRLGHSTVVVCLLEATQDIDSIKNCLNDFIHADDINVIVNQCTRDKYQFIKSDAFIRIQGPHEAGIKAYIISELINAGYDIHSLESDTYERNQDQQFIINMKGQAQQGIENLSISLDKLNEQGLETRLAKNWKLLE